MHDDSLDANQSPGSGKQPQPARGRGTRELSPTQRALGLLTRREHSRQELVRKLVSKGIDIDEVDAVVSKLAAAGWQDNVRFAESRVRVRVADGYGPRYIRAELATHGLDDTTIAAALDTFDGDWAAMARDLVRRRYGPGVADDLTLRRKAADLLLRRGFDATCARAATRMELDD